MKVELGALRQPMWKARRGLAEGGAPVEAMEEPPEPSSEGADGLMTQPVAPYGIPLIVQVEIPLQGRLTGLALL